VNPNRILQGLSVLVLLLFAGIWIWIGLALLKFNPTDADPVRMFTDAQTAVAGFLASAVGAGTASILGIEIQKASGANLAAQFGEAATSSKVLAAGILTYAAVGVFVLICWMSKSTAASDVIGAFALGVLGWLGGAFAAVFRKTSP
jgi:hypothetical protein